MTLSCSVHTGRCAAEHISVTWLKNSHHSAPQMIYYSGNKSCRRTESGETSCVYELLLRNLSSDDAGTFYCVLTSCGQTLFGNGTRIIVHSKTNLVSITIILSTIRSNSILRCITIASPPQYYYLLLHMVFINKFKQTDMHKLPFLLYLLLKKTLPECSRV